MSEIKHQNACCRNCNYFVKLGASIPYFGKCESEYAPSNKTTPAHFYCDNYCGSGTLPYQTICRQRDEIKKLNERIESLEKTIRRLKEALDQKLSARKLKWESAPTEDGNFICGASINEKYNISIYRDTSGLSLSSLRDNEPTKYAFVAYFETIDDQVIQIACEDTVYDTQVAVQRWLDDLAKSIQRKDME